MKRNISPASIKSSRSNESRSSALLKTLNIPVKFNDVDWSHINEMRTHERFEIRKKEFNLNKNKNIVYFSKKKMREHGQNSSEASNSHDEPSSTYRYSEDIKPGTHSKKYHSKFDRKSSTDKSNSPSDFSPRFTNLKTEQEYRGLHEDENSSSLNKKNWTLPRGSQNKNKDYKDYFKQNAYKIKINNLRKGEPLKIDQKNVHSIDDRTNLSCDSERNEKFETEDFDLAMQNSQEDYQSQSETSIEKQRARNSRTPEPQRQRDSKREGKSSTKKRYGQGYSPEIRNSQGSIPPDNFLGGSLGNRSRADSVRSNRSSRALFNNLKEIIAMDNKKHSEKKIRTVKSKVSSSHQDIEKVSVSTFSNIPKTPEEVRRKQFLNETQFKKKRPVYELDSQSKKRNSSNLRNQPQNEDSGSREQSGSQAKSPRYRYLNFGGSGSEELTGRESSRRRQSTSRSRRYTKNNYQESLDKKKKEVKEEVATVKSSRRAALNRLLRLGRK